MKEYIKVWVIVLVALLLGWYSNSLVAGLLFVACGFLWDLGNKALEIHDVLTSISHKLDETRATHSYEP